MSSLAPSRITHRTEDPLYTHSAIVAISEIKSEVRQVGNANDARITRIEESVSNYLNLDMMRAIQNQERIHYFDKVPCGSECLIIVEGPVRDILAVEVLKDGTWTAIDTANYVKERLHDGGYRPPGIEKHELPSIRPVNNLWGTIDFDMYAREPLRVRTTSGWSTIPIPIVEMALRMSVDAFKYPGMTTNIRNYEIGSRIRDTFELYSARPIGVLA